MKVLIISHLFPNRNDPRLGIFVNDQVKELSNFCKLTVFAPIPWFPKIKFFTKWYKFNLIKKYESLYNIKIFRSRRLVFPKGYFQIIIGLSYFISILFKYQKINEKFDIIHAHCVYADGFAAALLGLIYKTPVIITSHGADTYRFLENPFTRPLIKYSIKKAKYIIAVSQADKNIILKFCSDSIENKIKIISNGVNLDNFKKLNKRELRNNYKIPVENKVILYVGYLTHTKGVDLLLPAFYKVNEFNPNTFLIIVGDGVLRKKIENQIAKYNLNKMVLITGEKPHDEIPQWMNLSDVMVLPSRNEGWPTVLFEALACRLPIVASNVGGIPEVLYSENYGYLTKPNNIQDLSQKLLKAINTNWEKTKLISYAKENSWGIKAQEIFTLYKQALI